MTLLVGAVLTAAMTAACTSTAVERGASAASTPSPVRTALRLDGRSALSFRSAPRFTSKNGAFTLECRVRGAAPQATASLLGSRHYGGFGITWAHDQLGLDRPTGWVNVAEVPGTRRAGYLLLRPPRTWRTDEWTHIALSFDGRFARMHVAGRLVAEAVGRGGLRPCRLPLYIGADTDGEGNATQFFTGEIDDVRISDVARYAAADFTPDAKLVADAHTTLLLNFNDPRAPFADRSAYGRSATVTGHPTRVTSR